MLSLARITTVAQCRQGGDGPVQTAEIVRQEGGGLDRGAVGIILVNPPGAKYGRRGLDSFRRSRNFRPILDIPAVQLSQEEADALLQSADE